jgi:hypothetical protein
MKRIRKQVFTNLIIKQKLSGEREYTKEREKTMKKKEFKM